MNEFSVLVCVVQISYRHMFIFLSINEQLSRSIREILQLVMLLCLGHSWIMCVKHRVIDYVQRLLRLIEWAYGCGLAAVGSSWGVAKWTAGRMALHKFQAGFVIWQLRHKHISETVIEIVRLLLLSKHHSISGCREKDLLNEHVSRIRQEGHEREYKQHNPRLAWVHHEEVLSVDLRLEYLSDRRWVTPNNAQVIEEQTCYVHDTGQPVPIDWLNKEFADDNVHDECEGDATCEPVWLSQTVGISRTGETLRKRRREKLDL